MSNRTGFTWIKLTSRVQTLLPHFRRPLAHPFHLLAVNQRISQHLMETIYSAITIHHGQSCFRKLGASSLESRVSLIPECEHAVSQWKQTNSGFTACGYDQTPYGWYEVIWYQNILWHRYTCGHHTPSSLQCLSVIQMSGWRCRFLVTESSGIDLGFYSIGVISLLTLQIYRNKPKTKSQNSVMDISSMTGTLK